MSLQCSFTGHFLLHGGWYLATMDGDVGLVIESLVSCKAS